MLQRCSKQWETMALSTRPLWYLQAVLLVDAGGFARALCTALQVEPPAAQHSTATDRKVLMVDAASQTTADDVVDTATAEAMIAEALSMWCVWSGTYGGR